MKIVFIVPNLISITGGLRVVLEHAKKLSQRGHEVTIVSPVFPYGFFRHKLDVRRWIGWLHEFTYNIIHTHTLPGDYQHTFSIRNPLFLSSNSFPDADVIIATAWPTAFTVNRLPSSKGRKYYFIQGYEIWSGPKAKVEATWRLPLTKFTVASWLKDLGRNKFKVDIFGPIYNGINTDLFNVPVKFPHNPLTVGAYYNSQKLKGGQYALRALIELHRQRPDLGYYMFGNSRPKKLPSFISFSLRPKQHQLSNLYKQCDIFLITSLSEGMSLVPMEACACHCAVITTDIPGHRDFAIPNVTALFVPPAQVKPLVQSALQLINDTKKLELLASAGYKYVQRFTWAESTNQLELLLKML